MLHQLKSADNILRLYVVLRDNNAHRAAARRLAAEDNETIHTTVLEQRIELFAEVHADNIPHYLRPMVHRPVEAIFGTL